MTTLRTTSPIITLMSSPKKLIILSIILAPLTLGVSLLTLLPIALIYKSMRSA